MDFAKSGINTCNFKTTENPPSPLAMEGCLFVLLFCRTILKLILQDEF